MTLSYRLLTNSSDSPHSVDPLLTELGFMGTQTNFILKVLILSIGVSVLIKYGMANMSVAATPVNALIAVVTPTLVAAIALSWRAWKYQHSSKKS